MLQNRLVSRQEARQVLQKWKSSLDGGEVWMSLLSLKERDQRHFTYHRKQVDLEGLGGGEFIYKESFPITSSTSQESPIHVKVGGCR